MPELVISNTSPLFYLHRLGQLEVLLALWITLTATGETRFVTLFPDKDAAR